MNMMLGLEFCLIANVTDDRRTSFDRNHKIRILKLNSYDKNKNKQTWKTAPSSNRSIKQRFVKMAGVEIITWAETTILKEKTKWTVRVLKAFTLSQIASLRKVIKLNTANTRISFPMCWVELQPSFAALSSRAIGCRSFIKHSPWTVRFQFIMWKNLRVFVSHNSAEFHWTFHFQILY